MRVLLDENMPHKLRHSLTRHHARTVEEIGWAGVHNGDLLRIVEHAGFDVMITGDQNLSYQQNLTRRKMAVIVLSTNKWNVIKKDVAPIVRAVGSAKPGSFDRVEYPKTR